MENKKIITAFNNIDAAVSKALLSRVEHVQVATDIELLKKTIEELESKPIGMKE